MSYKAPVSLISWERFLRSFASAASVAVIVIFRKNCQNLNRYDWLSTYVDAKVVSFLQDATRFLEKYYHTYDEHFGFTALWPLVSRWCCSSALSVANSLLHRSQHQF